MSAKIHSGNGISARLMTCEKYFLRLRLNPHVRVIFLVDADSKATSNSSRSQNLSSRRSLDGTFAKFFSCGSDDGGARRAVFLYTRFIVSRN